MKIFFSVQKNIYQNCHFKAFAVLTEEQKINFVKIKLRKATSVLISDGKATISYENGKAEVTANGLEYDKKDNQQILLKKLNDNHKN